MGITLSVLEYITEIGRLCSRPYMDKGRFTEGSVKRPFSACDYSSLIAPTAGNAGRSIDLILAVAFLDAANGALSSASAAAHTSIADFISHG